MKTIKNVLLVIMCCYMSACKKNDAAVNSVITGVSPLTAGMGDTVTITGRDLDAAG